jgi:hypothetical protein
MDNRRRHGGNYASGKTDIKSEKRKRLKLTK